MYNFDSNINNFECTLYKKRFTFSAGRLNGHMFVRPYQKFRSLYWYAVIYAWKRKVHRLRPYVSFLLQIPYKRTTESFWSLVLGNLGKSFLLHALKFAQVDHIAPKLVFIHNFARLLTWGNWFVIFCKFKNFHFLPEVKVGQF